MAVTPGAFGEALYPGLRDKFGFEYDRYEVMYPKVFDMHTTKRAFEQDLQVVGLGLMGEKSPMAATAMQDPMQGYLVQHRPVAYGLGFGIAQEMWDDDVNSIVQKFPKLLAVSARETEETLASNVLNNGFDATNYSGYDGVAFFSASHPRVSGGTYSNLLDPADLSLLLLEAYMRAVAALTDDRGLHIHLKPQLLIIPRNEAWTASELLDSPQRPDTANRAVNPGYKFVPYIVWDYLTDTDATMMKTSAASGLVGFTREAPDFTRDNNQSTRAAYYYAWLRIVFSYSDPRCMLASAGAP